MKLGATDVSFRLGSATPAKAYLGGVEVWAAGRTLYFSSSAGAEDGLWETLANWFDDEALTVPAASLPTAVDDVVITENVIIDGATVKSATVNEAIDVVGELTVSGLLLVGAGANISGTVNGNAVFSSGALSGTLNGSAVFGGNSQLEGTVTGTATFNDSACNSGGTAGTFVPDPPPSC